MNGLIVDISKSNLYSLQLDSVHICLKLIEVLCIIDSKNLNILWFCSFDFISELFWCEQEQTRDSSLSSICI